MVGFETDVQDWQQAAEAGLVDAQYQLGLLYSSGAGVPLDYVSAHKWLNLAARAGKPEARSLRRELASDMSAGEMAEAQRLAREWIATHQPTAH